MKILIVRVSSIGDVIATLPAFFLLKRMLPHAQFSWVVQHKASALLAGQPWLENLWILPDKFLKPSNWRKTLATTSVIRAHRWDAIIDFQGLVKTSLLISRFRGPCFGFAPGDARSRLSCLTTSVFVRPVYRTIIQKNLALAAAVAKKLDPTLTTCPTTHDLTRDFSLAIDEAKNAPVIEWITNHPAQGYVTLSPNTTWESKKWPTTHWLSLIKLYCASVHAATHPLVLLGSHMGGQAAAFAAAIAHENLPVLIAPAWSLLQTASFLNAIRPERVRGCLRSALCMVAPDTGLLHLADFLSVPSVGIYGPTLLERHGPSLTRHQSIQAECPHYYEKKHGTIDCLALLAPERVLGKIAKILYEMDSSVKTGSGKP